MHPTQFQTRIDHVQPVKDDHGVKWTVTYSSVFDKAEQKTQKSDVFDGVIVCNGHYSHPLTPEVPGLDKFKGQVYHSHDYRAPECFQNQRVVILGAGYSGTDIMVELSDYADKIFLSHNKDTLTTIMPSNVAQRPGIASFTENSVVFYNNQKERVNAVMFCTGYKYTFPFLSEDCHLHVKDERVTPLYKHLLHTEYPSLSFVGICKFINPFPQFHLQALVILSVLDGSLKLPSRQEMDKDTESDFQDRLDAGMPPRKAHHMDLRQWAYNDELADMVNQPRLKKRIMDMYHMVDDWRAENVVSYKSKNLELVGQDSFKVIL